jgi:hypothetical protein
MKKISIIILTGIVILGTSCKKYLDVNTNPNSATSSTPDLVLPQAIVYTASNVSGFNNYGSRTVGYSANAGGYGGFGSVWTYNYATGDGSGLWQSAYDALEDIQYVINSTAGIDKYAYFNAAARIMKVYNFQLLIDEFNDVPYYQAFQGSSVISPKYDSAKALYVELSNQLDTAIATIKNASYPTALTSATDPLFSGNETYWKQFANTLKLKLIIRASAKITFSNTTFDAAGFLTTDAVVNPGYGLATGHVSPSWNTWVADYTGTRVGQAYIPAKFVFGYYDGNKLTDAARGGAIYYNFPNTPVNQLGVGDNSVPSSPSTAGSWYSGSGSGTTLGNAIGIMKGPDQGQPLLLAAESYFLQAEADIRGIVSGTAKTNFVNGITASFNYLYKLSNGTLKYTTAAADATTYISNNSTSYLANFDLATTPAQQLEAIITQKYIALNFIHGQEAWSEYRRTGYPVSSGVTTSNPYGSFASTLSSIPAGSRADKLPTRLPYATSEYTYNSANVPNIDNNKLYNYLIFWAK